LTENGLEQSGEGLWIVPGTEQQPFAYSDGDNAENYVHEIIAGAADTGSTSAELEMHIRDWPSEYHFTSKRATLLRALNLSGLEQVLELGCGCGAISRYLGEQGMRVDAIEGSTRRAQIAKARCRDLDNVCIVNANYNHLELPEHEYDAVFLIGVLEYARRFCTDAIDDRAAVNAVLAAIAKSLKPDGVMITAIENRLGLKYLLGATEDHYAVPYIGVNGYSDSAGIRTYDYGEWQELLAAQGFAVREFLAPFPDYKIPSVVLHEQFLDTPQVIPHLYAMTSRDYYRIHITGAEEGQFWKGFQQAGVLREFVNSYLIVTSRQGDRPAQIADSDFVHVSGPHRKLCYRVITRKPRDQSIVHKTRLADVEPPQDGLEQVLANEPHLSGELLSEVWLRTLLIWQEMDRLVALFRDYYAFLQGYARDHDAHNDLFDIQPFNIIVDEQGIYRPFDREWRLKEKVAPEYVLFRGLFWFVYGNSQKFAGLFNAHGFDSVLDFVHASFAALDLDLDARLDEYIDMEDRMHVAIGERIQPDLTRTLLHSAPAGDRGRNTFESKIYWARQGQPYSESNSLEKRVSLGRVRQQVVFDLPVMAREIKRLRFDPTDREGYFHIYHLKVVELDDQLREGRTLLQYDSGAELAQAAKMEGMVLHGSSSRAVFLSTGYDPWLSLVLPDNERQLRLIVEMDWPHSEEYEIVRAELKHLNDEWQWEKAKMQEQIDQLQRERGATGGHPETRRADLLRRIVGRKKP
jgi:cyclopropane fatty-acyl-phospholipid synthase-like methyltransferase